MDDGHVDVAGLPASLHGKCFRLLSVALQLDCEGLAIAARKARRSKLITNKTARRLEHLDVALAVSRHITVPRGKAFVEKLKILPYSFFQIDCEAFSGHVGAERKCRSR